MKNNKPKNNFKKPKENTFFGKIIIWKNMKNIFDMTYCYETIKLGKLDNK